MIANSSGAGCGIADSELIFSAGLPRFPQLNYVRHSFLLYHRKSSLWLRHFEAIVIIIGVLQCSCPAENSFLQFCSSFFCFREPVTSFLMPRSLQSQADPM